MRVIDIEVYLPGDVVVTVGQRLGRTHYVLLGAGMAALLDSIIEDAQQLGYASSQAGDACYLTRRDQCVTLLLVSPEQLDIVVDDPERLPLAQVTETGIALAGIELDLPGAVITPRRERHGSATWIAEWEIARLDARGLSATILGGLKALALRSVGTFEPFDAGVGDTWSTEASDARTTIAVHATQRADDVLLRIELVRPERS
jgi:hypothetical protein